VLEEAPQDEPKPAAFEVWPENVDAVELFVVVSGQWRIVAGFGGVGYLGLDYAAVEAAMNMRGVKKHDRPQLFADLRVMEAAAATMLNKRRDG
jgi:D-arabinose 1-dehydrogenase-like Zn-dependent alcohol dehydrogenase